MADRGRAGGRRNKGNISVTSPIARALIGKTRGETVEVETPGGAKVYQVRKVEWLGAPDKSMNYGVQIGTLAARGR